MISTKRGTTDYLILVTVTMIIAVVGIATSVIIGTELLDSSETSQSFESLVFNLENLESGISNIEGTDDFWETGICEVKETKLSII